MTMRAVVPPRIREQVPLAPLTTLELGGPAQYLAVAEDAATAVEALRWARQRDVPVSILGGGSNVVVADDGVCGLVVKMGGRGFEIAANGEVATVTVAGGEPWDEVVARTVEAGLAGLECLSGIPGTAGATPIQNVGAYGQEVARSLAWVEVLDCRSFEVERMPASACGFSYRTSRFRRRPESHLVLSVSFALRPGAAGEVAYPELAAALGADRARPSPREVRRAVLELRRAKSMLVEPEDPNRRSVGSFFLNPMLSASGAAALRRRAEASGLGAPPAFPAPGGRVKVSAAWLIERCGFPRGLRRGAVGISSRHSLALIHRGGGRSADLVALARDIRAAVRARFGIELVPEPRFLGFTGPDPTA